jgi:asparagine synthase (glutamine-hydrolysing)
LTALGGCVDWTQQADCRSDCISILEAQSTYSSQPAAVQIAQWGSFGLALHASLPEDRFDRQPLEERHLSLVADIRLDNRDQLIRTMEIDQFAAAEFSDAEILLRAWLRWDESCLDRIVGDYAFAIYSAEQRKLTLVRDPLGERPLVFATRPNGIAFASTPRGLLALRGPENGLDLAALRDVAAGVHPTTSSYFNGITKVLPGECISFTSNGRSSKAYWQPSLDRLSFNGQDDYVDAFREVLRSSVESRMRRRSGPVCTDLSSGFDSSAVAATAARTEGQDEVIAFTAAPREGFATAAPRLRFPDESGIAELTARMNGLRHIIVRPTGTGLSRMRALIHANQDPYYNYVNLGWIADVGSAIRDAGGTIDLTGEYGNLSLHAGGLRLLGDLIAAGRFRTWLAEARQTSRNPHIRWRGILINSFEAWMPDSFLAVLNRWSAGTRPRAESVFLRPQWLQDKQALETAYLPASCGNSYLDRLHMLRASDMGQLRKGYLALFGVEQRAPLGDRRVVEFSLRLPREQLLNGGEIRPLARRALRDRLPAEVLDARNRGYQGADWFERFDTGEIRGMVEEIAGNSTARNLIDVGKMHRALDHWPTGGFERFDTYQRLAVDLPMAIGTGLFIVEAEKWLAGRFD